MPTRTSLSLLIALLSGFTALSAQALDKEKLDRYFAVLDSSERFLGSVALSQQGQIAYTRSVGFAQLEPLQKADENTRYRIGYFPDTKTAFALCANGSRINNNDVSIALLSAANGKHFDLPTFSIYTINEADLDLYPGSYASAQIPLKISIRREGQRLMAQATGQPSFPLEATALHVFKFEQAGIVMEFDPENQRLLLKQAGAEFLFEKE